MQLDLDTKQRLDHERKQGALRQAESREEERESLASFQSFHSGLANPRRIVYLFFTGNLLHWLSRALSFVPAGVNVILIGSHLGADEQDWVRRTYRYPFHHIAERVDDNTVLEFIFQVAQHDFAWLHIDCFVLNPALFDEMMRFAPDVVMNAIWIHPGPAETMHSAFVSVHHAVLEAIGARGIEVSPCTYHYAGASVGRTVSGRPLFSRVPAEEHVELLAKVLPAGPSGLPVYPVGDCFEVMELYQLIANALGYRLNNVRRLIRDGSVSAEHYSNEIIHVNGVSTYRKYKTAGAGKSYIDNQEYFLLLQADHAILAAMGEDVPERYRRLRAELSGELAEIGLSGDQARTNLFGFLLSRGVCEESCARILGVA